MAREKWADAHGLLVRARRKPADSFLKAEIFQKDAEALRALGRFRESLSCSLSAHRIYRQLRIPTERISSLLGASACLRVLGRYAEARRLWARDIHPHVSQVDLERALVARGQGKFAETRQRLARAIKLLSRAGSVASLSDLQHAYWISGGLERFTGNFQKARQAFQRAFRLARRSGDVSAEAFALCGLGGVERVLGFDRASLSHYGAAHRLLKKKGDPFGEAYGLCGQANVHRTFGDARRCLPLYRRSAALYRRLGDESSEAFAHWGLGGSFRRLKQFRSAFVSYQKALRLFKKSKDERGVIMTHLGLARWAEEQGQTDEALRQGIRGLAVARRANLRYETALARYEIGRRQRPLRPPFGILKSSGISTAVLKRWRDIP